MPKLVIQEQGDTRVLRLGEDLVTIGRAPTNTVQIRDAKGSRQHCHVSRTDQGWKVVDLESVNGITVNGAKTNQAVLRFGDRIEIGACCIVFERDASDSGLHPSPRYTRRSIGTGRRIPSKKASAERETEPLTAGEPDADEKADAALRESIDACLKQWGPESGLESVASVVDEYYRSQRGEPREGALVEMRDSLLRLVDINKAITTEHNLKRLLDMILDAVVEMTSAERGFIILTDDAGTQSIRVARNFDREDVRRPEDKVSHSIADTVMKSGRTIRAQNAQTDQELHSFMSVTELKLRSLLCVPLRVRGATLGCFYLDNRFEEGLFTETHQRLLEAFADQATVAIENARLWEENQKRMEELKTSKEQVEKLNKLLEEKLEAQKSELTVVKQDLDKSLEKLELKYNYSNIVGRNAKMQDVFRMLDRVTDTNVPVLIQGESGTGKELVARAIHFNGPRRKARFVGENCAAITETLLESELFGHTRGSFTGATEDRKGLFELADGGTLFLDEIGDMSLEMQKKVLRTLQSGDLRRVGGKDLIHVDTRIISASNRDLKELIKESKFREDLYYRINVVTIQLPPLRDRRDDVPLLVERILDSIAHETNTRRGVVDAEALRMLASYSWPGNVRELENELRRLMALTPDGRLLPEHLKEEIRRAEIRRPGAPSLGGKQLKDLVREVTDQVEKDAITQVLRETGWVKTEASRVLGISRVTLDAKIEAFGLQKE